MTDIATTVPVNGPVRVAAMQAGALGLLALQLSGVKSAVETLSDADWQLIQPILNMMLDEWTADGANQWRVDDADLPWPAQTFELQPSVDGLVDIEDVQFFVTESFSRPLARWEKADMDRLPVQGTVGAPTCYSVRNTLTGPSLRLWPAPAQDSLLHVTYVRANANVTAQSDMLDIPVRWQSTVLYALAERLLTPFQVWSSNAAEAQRISDKADVLYQRLRADDRPASYTINPWSAYP